MIKYILGDGLSNNKFDVISNNSNMQPVSDIDFKKSLFQIITPLKKKHEISLENYKKLKKKDQDKKILEKLKQQFEME